MRSPSPLLPDPQTADQKKLGLVLALIFITVNLRPMLTGVGPVLDSIRNSLHLSNTVAGLLITLPILCLGAFAPLVPRLLAYFSPERLVTLGMAILLAGMGVRSLYGSSGLFMGTLIGGAGISMVMVVLPGIIKQHFPSQASFMMGVYSTALCLGATIAAALAVPLEDLPGSNWRWSLAFWILPAALSLLLWQPFARPQAGPSADIPAVHPPKLRHNRLAWHVTFFMGTQSTVAYCMFGWLPVILIDRGLNPLQAGFVLSVLLGVQVVTSLLAPWLAQHSKDQRLLIIIMSVMTWVGLAGLFYAPLSYVWVMALIGGLGMGGIFALALALLVLRASNALVAASLSGMVQGVGYTLAATGPLIVGWLHEISGNWHTVAAYLALLMAIAFACGMSAGRNLLITPTTTIRPSQVGLP